MRTHKYSNAPKGYDLIGKTDPWYQKHFFPIVPMIDFQEADEYNPKSFSFSWLFIRAWSLSHFAFEAAIELESTGLNVKFILPYLRIVLRIIPLPWDVTSMFRRKP